MSDQHALRQRREALAQAVNSHDLEAVLSFIHPSFVGKTKRGYSVGYQDMVRMAEPLFAPGKDYQETVEIEEIEVSGDSAKLVVRRVERGRLYDPKMCHMCNFLGLMFLMFLGISILNVIRTGEWNFQNALSVVGYAVASVALLGSAFVIRGRSTGRSDTKRPGERSMNAGFWLKNKNFKRKAEQSVPPEPRAARVLNSTSFAAAR